MKQQNVTAGTEGYSKPEVIKEGIIVAEAALAQAPPLEGVPTRVEGVEGAICVTETEWTRRVNGESHKRLCRWAYCRWVLAKE